MYSPPNIYTCIMHCTSHRLRYLYTEASEKSCQMLGLHMLLDYQSISNDLWRIASIIMKCSGLQIYGHVGSVLTHFVESCKQHIYGILQVMPIGTVNNITYKASLKTDENRSSGNKHPCEASTVCDTFIAMKCFVNPLSLVISDCKHVSKRVSIHWL